MEMQKPPTFEEEMQQVVTNFNTIMGVLNNSKTQFLGIANQLSMVSNSVETATNNLQQTVNFLLQKVQEQHEENLILKEKLPEEEDE
jgi:ferritin